MISLNHLIIYLLVAAEVLFLFVIPSVP